MKPDKVEGLFQLSTSCLTPFSRHPYKVRDDDAMRDMAESVKQYGVLSPAIARPLPDGGYELVSGHRRKRACELAGLETSSASWTTTRRLSSSWTAICSAKACFRARERLRTS